MPSQNLFMFSVLLLQYCYIYYSYTLYLSGAQMSLAIRCCGTGLAICPVIVAGLRGWGGGGGVTSYIWHSTDVRAE